MNEWGVVLLLFALAGSCLLGSAALSKLRAVARAQPDPAWKPTGIRYLHEGYDYSKGIAGAKRAAIREERRRKVEARVPVTPPSPPARVPVPFNQNRRVG